MEENKKSLFIFNKKLLNIILFSFLILLFSFSLFTRIYAANKLGYMGDEPDDFSNIQYDLTLTKDFFTDAPSAEQSRLSHFVTVIAVSVNKNQALLIGRVISILAFIIFLIIIYKLLRLYLSYSQAIFGTSTVGFSSYLSSFSIFAMTSSNSIYLLFSTLSIYLYMKYIKENKLENSKYLVLLGSSIGLAMASKLFAGMIIVAILIDNLLHEKNKRNFKLFSLKKLVEVSAIEYVFYFLIGWLVINILPIDPIIKLYLSGVISIIYLIKLITYKNEKIINLAFSSRWLIVLLVAFCVFIISSPIYLNIHNIINIFNWSNDWNNVNLITNQSSLDPLLVLFYKFGWYSSVVLFITVVWLLISDKFRLMVKQYGLLFLILVIHTLAFIAVNNYFAWYSTVVFWILYIPFCYLFPKNIFQSLLTFLIALFLILIPVTEQYRYLNLFPYGHTDGAQYGENLTGWSKPGFITFEAMPLIKEYLLNNNDKEIYCNLTSIKRYNAYASNTLNLYLRNSKIDNSKCIDDESAKFVLTTNYTSKIDVDNIRKNARKYTEFKINTVDVATLWEK